MREVELPAGRALARVRPTLIPIEPRVTDAESDAAARCDSEGAGGAVAVAACEATGIDVGAPYVVAPPGMVPTAGPLVPPVGAGGTVWFCLTRSSRPISAIAGRHRVEKWYLASTSFWLTPCAD